MGQVFNSQSAANPKSWTSQLIDTENTITSVSCPSASGCFAVDSTGNLLVSKAPTSATSWTASDIDLYNTLNQLDCPTASFCVAVDDVGNILYSSNPTQPTSWQTLGIDNSNNLISVSCPTVSFCAAVDTSGNVIYSDSPTTGKWQVFNAESNLTFAVPTTISCIASQTCYIAGSGGMLIYSTSVDSGAGSFVENNIDSGNSLTAISCDSSGCGVGDSAGNILFATNPQSTGWLKYNLAGSTLITSLECSDINECVAGTANGTIAVSSSLSNALGWNLENLSIPQPVSSVLCTSASYCLVTDSAGQLWAGNFIPGANAPLPSCSTTINNNCSGVNSLKSVQLAGVTGVSFEIELLAAIVLIVLGLFLVSKLSKSNHGVQK
jgi:hypothetical protein